jgi:hypothetical protein
MATEITETNREKTGRTEERTPGLKPRKGKSLIISWMRLFRSAKALLPSHKMRGLPHIATQDRPHLRCKRRRKIVADKTEATKEEGRLAWSRSERDGLSFVYVYLRAPIAQHLLCLSI